MTLDKMHKAQFDDWCHNFFKVTDLNIRKNSDFLKDVAIYHPKFDTVEQKKTRIYNLKKRENNPKVCKRDIHLDDLYAICAASDFSPNEVLNDIYKLPAQNFGDLYRKLRAYNPEYEELFKVIEKSGVSEKDFEHICFGDNQQLLFFMMFNTLNRFHQVCSVKEQKFVFSGLDYALEDEHIFAINEEFEKQYKTKYVPGTFPLFLKYNSSIIYDISQEKFFELNYPNNSNLDFGEYKNALWRMIISTYFMNTLLDYIYEIKDIRCYEKKPIINVLEEEDILDMLYKLFINCIIRKNQYCVYDYNIKQLYKDDWTVIYNPEREVEKKSQVTYKSKIPEKTTGVGKKALGRF